MSQGLYHSGGGGGEYSLLNWVGGAAGGGGGQNLTLSQTARRTKNTYTLLQYT